MRRVTVLSAGVSVLAITIAVATGRHYLVATAATEVAKADKAELVTGAISAGGPNAAAEKPASAPPSVSAPQAIIVPEKPAAPAPQACANPNALGLSRTVEIDATGGPGLGLSQYRDYDFLQPGEVVLTFDDGPWPGHTQAVLAALAAQCVKAVFFPIGKHASWHPDILKQVVAQGHTIGSHTWSHVNLAKKPLPDAKAEIEKGISAVALAAGQPIAPFFRFPQLRQTAELKGYLGERNVATFSIDIDSEDFRIHKPAQLIDSTMTKLKKAGKGIILMHDFQASTAAALPELLLQLKAGGYKVVYITTKSTVATLPDYDAAVAALTQPLRSSAARPIASVVRTVSGN